MSLYGVFIPLSRNFLPRFQTGIEVHTVNAIQLLMEDTKQYAIKYPKIQYPKHKEGLLYELDMPDLHFGKLAWAEETGQDYDIQIAAEAAHDAFTELLGYVQHFPVWKILLHCRSQCERYLTLRQLPWKSMSGA